MKKRILIKSQPVLVEGVNLHCIKPGERVMKRSNATNVRRAMPKNDQIHYTHCIHFACQQSNAYNDPLKQFSKYMN